MEQKRESMNKNRIRGVSVGRADRVLQSPTSIKDAERRSGDCARKAVELTSGDLAGGQKSAEGVVGPDVGEASEALESRKAEKRIG